MASGTCSLSASEPARAALRNGVGPSWVGLRPGPWPTLLDFLVQHFAQIGRTEWLARMARGEVVDDSGAAVTPETRYQPQGRLHYYRCVADEAELPFAHALLFQDAHLVVADKPHGLPVTPSGRYLQHTLLARLRHQLGLADLVPLHRIDRETAGLVLFSVQPTERAAYHALFSQRTIEKTYEAVAAWRDDLALPLSYRSRVGPAAEFFRQQEEVGPANAETRIALLRHLGCHALYQLTPSSGRRHQLRVQMAALGLPIVGDTLYPTLRRAAPQQDTSELPLQLLARSLRFVDPISGAERHFESRQQLASAGPGLVGRSR